MSPFSRSFFSLIGRVFPGFLAATGRLVMFLCAAVAHSVWPPLYPRPIRRRVVDDYLHPSGKVHAPWVDTIVSLAESAVLKEETP